MLQMKHRVRIAVPLVLTPPPTLSFFNAPASSTTPLKLQHPYLNTAIITREAPGDTPHVYTHTHTQIIMNPHTEDGLVSSCTQRSPRLRHKSSLSHGPCIFSPRTFRFMTPPRRTTASVITSWVLAPSTFCCRSKHGMRRKVKTTHGVGRIKQVLC